MTTNNRTQKELEMNKSLIKVIEKRYDMEFFKPKNKRRHTSEGWYCQAILLKILSFIVLNLQNLLIVIDKKNCFMSKIAVEMDKNIGFNSQIYKVILTFRGGRRWILISIGT